MTQSGDENQNVPGSGETAMQPPKITLKTPQLSSPRMGSLVNILKAAEENFDAVQHDDDEDDDKPIKYRKFKPDSFAKLLAKEQDYNKRQTDRKKNQNKEGKLVDGHVEFEDDPYADEDKISHDPELIEGNKLPESTKYADFPKELTGTPIEEIDKYIRHKSFVVINTRVKKKFIFRFSATNAFFCFAPWNPIRRFFLAIATNQFFDYLIMLTILTNCVFLTLPDEVKIAEYIFLGVYTIECIIKLMARGLVLDPYTYLRDAWNWLDIVVVALSYIMLIIESVGTSSNVNINALRTFRVFRVLKTISIFPGLKTIISALLKSFRMLFEVILLTFFCMGVFSLFALQLYMGVFRNKCVKKIDWADYNLSYQANKTTVDAYFDQWIKNKQNWLLEKGDQYWVCGNNTGAGTCNKINANYTCLPDIGDNPNWGYTNFDNFGWALLSMFQLITLDFWENQYNYVIRISGPWNIIFFIAIVFFGSFYLINLMLAVVTMSYDEQASADVKMQEKEEIERKKKKKLLSKKKQQHDMTAEEKQKQKRKKKKSKKDKENKEANEKEANGDAKNEEKNGNEDKKKEENTENDGKKNEKKSPDKGPKSPDKTKKTDKPKDKNDKEKDKSNKEKDKTPEKSKDKSPSKNVVVPSATTSNNVKLTTDNSGSPNKISMSPVKNESPKKVFKRSETRETLESEGKQSNKDSGMGSQPEIAEEQETGGTGVETAEPAAEEDEEAAKGPVIIVSDNKEYVDRNCPCCHSCCLNFICWLKFQNSLYTFVTDPFFDIFITLCIGINTIILACENYPSTDSVKATLLYSNYLFTVIFTMEAALKIPAMSKEYFYVGWNVFDLIVVIASLIDLAVEDIDSLTIFRTFRLFRVFKLAQSWSTMRLLLVIIFSTITALGNLTFILVIIIFIFAVIGMQLFRGSYKPEIFGTGEDDIPRWNFEDFGHSMMMVFRVLCGEWIEPLWDCMRANSELCMVVFIPTLILGNFMVLNLFLALLLNSFGSDKLKSSDKDADGDGSKFAVAVQRVKNLVRWRKLAEKKPEDVETGLVADGEKKEGETQVAVDVDSARGSSEMSSEDVSNNHNKHNKSPNKSQSMRKHHRSPGHGEHGKKNKKHKHKDKIEKHASVILEQPSQEAEAEEADKNEEKEGKKKDEDEEEKKELVLEDCCCLCCLNPCQSGACCQVCACCLCLPDSTCGSGWTKFRFTILTITEHKVFEGAILLTIFASSISLCFEDIYLDDKPDTKAVLKVLNIIFAVLFTMEMFLKWIALGFKKYFTRFWTILDFCIVMISLVDLLAEAYVSNFSQISAFRALRTLRAFRPLRSISRWQGMKIVVNALMSAIPSIFNVLLVCLVFWLIFSITGVQFFKGKFFKCVDAEGDRLSRTIVKNKTDCLAKGYQWKNSLVTFDNVGAGYLALYQVATFEGWMEVMKDAVDITDIDEQPLRENQMGYYVFFVIFIIVGSFFTLNLFIGVIIDNFNTLKKKYEGNTLDMFLTQSQKNYYRTMKKLGKKKPQKTIRRPKNRFQEFFFDVAVSTKFELTIVVLIMLNMIAMMLEHYKQIPAITQCLEIVNIVFTTIFTFEAIIKIVGLRWHYFRRPWNVFDFVIVILSIVGAVLADIVSNVFVTPTLLRVVRIVRIGRVLRLIKAAKGIRKLLFALIISLPALFNIGALLLLVVFIYSIIGMSVFSNVKHAGAIDDMINFETFERSMLLLFRLTTSGGWNDIYYPLQVSEPDCNSTHVFRDGTAKAIANGECSTAWLATIYLCSYIFFTYLIIINMYIAVILENFNQAHEQEEVGITDDDFDMFYVIWERFDPYASQYIKYEQLSDFVAELEEPLGIPKPNIIALTSFDLPIMEGDRLHCLDVLMALVRKVLDEVEDTEEFREIKTQMEMKFRSAFPTRVQTIAISTTMRRKKEDIAAKTLQRAWRRHKAQRAFRQVTENAMAMAGRQVSNMAAPPGQLNFGSSVSIKNRKPSKPAPPLVHTSDQLLS